MKNILSYKLGTVFKGREIKDWILYHTNNETSKSKIAKRMTEYLTIDNDEWYYLWKDPNAGSRANDYLVARYDPFNHHK